MEFNPVVVLGDVVVHVEPAQVVEEVSPVVEEEVSQVVDAPVVDAPVVEDSVVEDAVVEDPVVEAPVVETPFVETPVVETPFVETPVVETPVVETPVVETPLVEEEEVILLTEEKEKTVEPEQRNPPEVTPSALEIARQMFIRKQQQIIQQQNSIRNRMRSLFSFR